MNVSRALQLMAMLAIERKDDNLFQVSRCLFYRGLK